METNCGFCKAVRTWLAKPFDENGNVGNWFLFVGLIGVISWLWTRILARILR